MSSPTLIVNEVLAFINHAQDTMDEISIVQICKSNFLVEEICRAKVLLCEVLGKSASMPSRRRDEKGERSLQDIITLIKETDPDDVPVFVARDLNKLPPVTFDHVDVTRLLKDITTLKSSLAQVQCRLDASESTVKDLRAELLSLKSNNSECRSVPPDVSNVNTRRGAQNASIGSVQSAESESPLPCATNTCDAPRPAARSTPARVDPTSRQSIPRSFAAVAAIPTVAPSRQPVTQGKKCSARDIRRQPVGSGPRKDLPDEEGFVKVQRKKKRPACRNHLGTAPIDTKQLRPEIKSTQLYVSRLHWSTRVEDVVDYVLKKSTFNLRVERLASRHKVNFNSFVVRVPTHHLETFMKEDFWPQGVVFRKFRGRLPADTPRHTSPTLRVA